MISRETVAVAVCIGVVAFGLLGGYAFHVKAAQICFLCFAVWWLISQWANRSFGQIRHVQIKSPVVRLMMSGSAAFLVTGSILWATK
jgi:hypothetical protein